MSKETTVTVTCDKCKKSIEEQNYIDAGTYGKDFHIACIKNMNGLEMLIALELDDIRYSYSLDKVIYYHEDGTHRG